MTRGRGPFSGSVEVPFPARRRFRTRAWLLSIATLAVAAGVAPGPAVAIEEEDIAGQLGEYRLLLEQATGHLEALDFSEAIDAYTRLIDAYKTGRIPMVTPDAHELVAKSYEGRALALANLGRNPEASADFESLIRFDPAYAVDLSGISPKIVSLYGDVRKRTVGVITIETDPLGAEVTLNGRSLGPAPITDREVVEGTYALRIVRAGFDPVEEEIVVAAGGRETRQIRLNPNARSIRIATVPREVKVIVDGEEKGSTFGTAGPEYQDAARELRLGLSEISEPLLVENLPPGEHDVLLRKECYQEVVVPITIEVDPENNAPLAYKPFVLAPSRGTLAIESEPSGASVLLDGEPRGKTPLTIQEVCSGRHDLLLEKEGVGRSAGTVEVRKDQRTGITERLRLSVAALDLRMEVPYEESLGASLRGMQRYNVVDAASGVTADQVERVRLELQGTEGRGLSERTVRDLMEELSVELVALAAPAGALGDRVDFLLFGPLHFTPDRRRLESGTLSGFASVRDALERPLQVEAAWTGLKLIDVRGEPHPIVLSVTPGGPASESGIRPGDRIASVGGTPIRGAAEFLAAVRGAGPGDEAAYSLERAGGVEEVRVAYLSTPVLLRAAGESLLYNKAIADLRQLAAMASNPRARSYAWLNIGIALMQFGEWEKAIRDAFRAVDLPEGAGISRGTVQYLSGLCYEKLGLVEEARSAYELAAASPLATVGSHDGRTIASSAARRAAALSSGK